MPRCFTVAALLLVARCVHARYQNVYGDKLQPCSSNGMALTGFTRNGYCVETNDDAGSHHICIDLSSATGGNFCTVTGQSDWCSSEEMPCHEDYQQTTCAIQNWCVCQWAFASYLQQAGGCDQIQEIVCESINLQAVLAYQQNKAKYSSPLECLVQRCNLDVAKLERMAKFNATENIRTWVWGSLAIVVAAAGFVIYKRQKRNNSIMKQDGLLDENTKLTNHSRKLC